MRAGAGRFDSGRGRLGAARATRRTAAAGALIAAVSLSAALAAAAPAAPGARGATVHAICSGPNSAKVPCRFSTPSGNIRCIWTPRPNSVACKLRATGRAYRLGTTGRAKAVTLKHPRPGRALPVSQQIVFPSSLSCHDSRTTMTCNQDFGTGAFTLAPGASHRS
jgi:hypothetical protein